MNNYILFPILITFLFYLLNLILKKKKILIDKSENFTHKKFVNNENVPISGGILFIFVIFILSIDLNIINKVIIFSVFLLGFLSDLDKLKSPPVRLILQSIIVGLFIFLNDLFVTSTRILFLDNFLENYFLFKLIFTLFCVIILLNGFNFIDGVNGLASGYFICVVINLILLTKSFDLQVDQYFLSNILIYLFIFFVFNFFSKSFLGDSGSYLLSFFIGFYLVDFFNNNNFISPYYIILLLWYPAFENLFTIFRRLIFEKRKVKNPDNFHLHHLIYIGIKKKVQRGKFNNSLTGILINLFNFIIIYIGGIFPNHTFNLLMLVLFAVAVYITTYIILKRNIIN